MNVRHVEGFLTTEDLAYVYKPFLKGISSKENLKKVYFSIEYLPPVTSLQNTFKIKFIYGRPSKDLHSIEEGQKILLLVKMKKGIFLKVSTL